MRFREFFEVANLGLQVPSTGQFATTAGWGAAKAAVNAIPGVGNVVGTAMDIADTVNQVIELAKKGQNVKPYILKLMATKDQMPGTPANAFDLEDSVADRISDKAKMELADSIVLKLQQLLRAGHTRFAPDLANREAHNYLMGMLRQFRGQIQGATP